MSTSLSVQLGAYLTAVHGRPFSWRDANCCHFAAGWVALVTGRDPMAGLQSTGSAAQALRLVRSLGGDLVAAWSHQLGRVTIPPAMAQLGDIVLLPVPAETGAERCTGTVVGICVGMLAVVPTVKGDQAFVPMAAAIAAWQLRPSA